MQYLPGAVKVIFTCEEEGKGRSEEVGTVLIFFS
jgi:hypothetical protein